MAIKIMEEPDIHLSRDEHDRLRQEYERRCQFMVDPPSFEKWVRSYKDNTVTIRSVRGVEMQLTDWSKV